MCYALAAAIKKSRIVSGSQMAVLLSLAGFASARNQYQAWPSIQTVADDIGRSRSTVERALSQLVARQLISVVAIGARGVKIYQIILPEGFGAPASESDVSKINDASSTSNCWMKDVILKDKPEIEPVKEEVNISFKGGEADFGHVRPEGMTKEDHITFLLTFGFISQEDLQIAVKLADCDHQAGKKENAIDDAQNFELALTDPNGEELPDMMDRALMFFKEIARQNGLRTIRDFTPERRKKLHILLQDVGGLSVWEEGLQMITDAPHLQGYNDRGWKAGFDWLVQKKNFIRLLEGECASWGQFNKQKQLAPSREQNRNDTTINLDGISHKLSPAEARILARAQARDDAQQAAKQGQAVHHWHGDTGMATAPLIDAG